jgi:hypothetical protein
VGSFGLHPTKYAQLTIIEILARDKIMVLVLFFMTSIF